VRAKVSEGAIAASALKIGVTEMFADSGTAGLLAYSVVIAADQPNLVTDKISAVAVNGVNGEVTVTLAGIAQLGATNALAYMPSINSGLLTNANSTGSISWVCSSVQLPPSGIGVLSTTNILPKFLPANCR